MNFSISPRKCKYPKNACDFKTSVEMSKD
jgi:hypothetical protein